MLTEEQKRFRLDYISGSDAPIICGLSFFCTPQKLWEYKTKRAVQEDIGDLPHVKAGIMLEGALREWLSEVIGMKVAACPDTFTSDKHHWMIGNIDGLIGGCNAIAEIKTSSHVHGWGDDGTSIIPRAYHVQVAHYMAVTNTERCYVGVLIRGVDFRHYCIERDIKLERYIIEKEKEFWDCVLHDTPPNVASNYELLRLFDEMRGN